MQEKGRAADGLLNKMAVSARTFGTNRLFLVFLFTKIAKRP